MPSFLSFRILACAAACSLVSFVTLVCVFSTAASALCVSCEDLVIEMLPMPLKALGSEANNSNLKIDLVIAINFAVSRRKLAIALAAELILAMNSSVVAEPETVFRASNRPLPIVSFALLLATESLLSDPA